MNRNAGLSLVAALCFAAASQAAPLVTATVKNIGGYDVLDFYYTASPGAEFTNYRLFVQMSGGQNTIQDPVKSATFDQDGDALDTWMNTVYSLYGFGPASYNFNTYKPTGLGSNTPPINTIDWSVFDTGAGDTNSFDAGAPYGVVSAPFHLARVLVSRGTVGAWSFQAFDTQTTAGAAYSGTWFAPLPEPEPTTISLIVLALFAGLGLRARAS